MSATPALSVLDVAPVPEGTTPSAALRRITDLARLAERLGYVRIWYAEHHAMPNVASSSPEILIAHVAASTTRIRVGSGGVMLPNHPPLRVAENFQTLAALHPGRIDLGLGRAPGGVPGVLRALRAGPGDQFSAQLDDMLAFSRHAFADEPHPFSAVHAMPADAPLPPIWILGSSGASARLAGSTGVGYGFASHFSPTPAAPAMLTYRQNFTPSAAFPKPHAILGVAVICADTDDEAAYLAATMDLFWLRLQKGQFLPLPSPEQALAYPYEEYEREVLQYQRSLAVIGSPATVRERLLRLASESQADEIMVTSGIYDHAARLRSYELLAAAFA